MLKIMKWAAVLAVGIGATARAAENPASCDFAVNPPAGIKIYGSLPVRPEPDRSQLVFEYEPHQNKNVSGGFSVALKPVAAPVTVAECEVEIGGAAPGGNAQVSGRLLFDFSDAKGKESCGFTIGSKRYHNDRKVFFTAGGKQYEIPFQFLPNEPMTLRLAVDRGQGVWYGEILKAGNRIFTTENQALENPRFNPALLRVIGTTVNGNDGMKITVKAPVVKAVAAESGTAENSEEFCSTLPRKYANVNPALYNSAFTNFTGNNLCDRMGLADPAEAEKRARELSDFGFTAVLYNGRHFRANFIEEFDQIADAARIVREACSKYGISVIEHHDPTIMSYRGYPFMLDKLDWLQRDIRSGESSYWFCPGNEDFTAYMLGYLGDYQRQAQVAGFMIDELNLANRNCCGCSSCRAGFAADTGDRAPLRLDHNNPAPAQKKFRSWGLRMIGHRHNQMLNALQKVKPDTILMTYCSDYGDPISTTTDLAEAAALYSPFVGWENMIYNPLESHTSMLCNLKMRNSYGDFYQIPVWSLNREAVTREAHYLSWAMCQGTRHSIWYGMRDLLNSPENVEYFKRYSRWPEIMPHRYARTLTDTGILLSLQTWRATADRRFFWEDFRGVLDTFIRSSRQFDTLLDGDLFYPGRLNKYKVLVLPSQAALSDRQCANLEQWVRDGGVALLTNNTSLYDAHGNRRIDFKLGEAMNLRSTAGTFGKGRGTARLAGVPAEFAVPFNTKVELLQPQKSNVLAEYTAESGESMPLVVETAYGKGRFLYLAAPLGRVLYELEMRNGRAYNYQPQPDLAALLNGLYDAAHRGSAPPVTAQLPDKVIAIANQLEDGPGKGNLYVQLYNFTGSKIKPGDKLYNGAPENITFPAIAGDLKITVNTPCADKAVLASPERPDVAIAGRKEGDATVFTVPGSALGGFAQLKIAAEPYAFMAIQEPPTAEPDAVKPLPPAAKINLEKLYEKPALTGTIAAEIPVDVPASGFGLAADGAITLNGKPLVSGGELRQSKQEYKDWLRSEPLRPAVLKGWRGGDALGTLSAGRAFGQDMPWVCEVARLSPDRLEVTLAATVMPKDHQGANASYAFRVPVEMLRGAQVEAYIGMHRSGRPPRRFALTGKESDGLVADSLRSVQFTGGAADFSIDFACMGPWGLFVEDLMSQYKAHLVKEGDCYWFILPCNDIRYGGKYSAKIVFRNGKSNFEQIHPQQLTQYQYGRPISARLQFTAGNPATGFTVRPGFNFDREFTVAEMKLWQRPEAVKLVRIGDEKFDPLFNSGARGEGDNSYTFDHPDAVALVNVILSGKAGAIRGTVAVNGGKAQAFDIPVGEVETAVLPVRIDDGKIRVNFTGNYLVSGIVVQVLAYPEEDFLWRRGYWNCGVSPWLLPELNCDPVDWRFYSDVPFRRARWNN